MRTRQSLKRYLFSGSLWLMAGKFLTALSGLGINIFLARILKPEEFGNYFIALSLVTFLSIIAQFGMKQTATRLVAESLAKDLPGKARSAIINMFIFTLVGALTLSFIWYLGLGKWLSIEVFKSTILTEVIVLIALWMIFFSFQSLYSEFFRGFHDIPLATIFGGMVSGLSCFFAYWLLWAFDTKLNLYHAILITIISLCLNFFLASFFLTKKVLVLRRGDYVNKTEIIKIAWPLLITSLLLFTIQQGHLWILGALSSDKEVAIFGAVLRLIVLLTIPLFIVNNVIPPKISELYVKGKKKEVQKLLQLTATVAGMPTIVFLMILIFGGDSLLKIVYGDYYMKGSSALGILSIGHLINVWTGSPGVLLIMSGNEKVLMNISIICGLSGICLSFLIVQRFSYNGVALGATLGIVLHNTFMWFYCRTILDIKTNFSFKYLKLFKTNIK